MIQNIILRNIKCFSRQEFKFSALNILAGINGVGKSTVIQSILLAAQTEQPDELQLNGSLIDIGNYSDLIHENADDESVGIQIESDLGVIEWGYAEGYSSETVGKSLTVPSLKKNPTVVEGIKRNLVYVCAERWGPRSNVPLKSHYANENWLGKYGELTIPFLAGLHVGSRRGKDGKLLSTLPSEDSRLHSSSVGDKIYENIVAWMGEISPNVDISAAIVDDAKIGYSTFGFSGSKQFKATNVGFGLSYALSVVTALVSAKKGAVVVLENPEAHLHPSGQSKVGELMALAANSGVQIIVETHSEHIINGARITVRKEIVEPNLINLIYISRKKGYSASDVEVLKLNSDGQLNNWPEGFFDQQAIDLKTLITGK